MGCDNPIGIFDSGIGGLTVLKECIKLMPNENYIYVGDLARMPYGDKPKDIIVQNANRICRFLQGQNVKMMVSACNTVSAYAIKEVKNIFSIPIMGIIESGVEAAIGVTKNNNIAVIATQATVKSGEYKREIEKHNNYNVCEISCSEFVPLIEEGLKDENLIRTVVRNKLFSLIDSAYDTLVLGCTHFPYIEEYIKEILPGVNIVNPAKNMAIKIRNYLHENSILKNSVSGYVNVFLSKDSEVARELCKEYNVQINLLQ